MVAHMATALRQVRFLVKMAMDIFHFFTVANLKIRARQEIENKTGRPQQKLEHQATLGTLSSTTCLETTPV